MVRTQLTSPICNVGVVVRELAEAKRRVLIGLNTQLIQMTRSDHQGRPTAPAMPSTPTSKRLTAHTTSRLNPRFCSPARELSALPTSRISQPRHQCL